MFIYSKNVLAHDGRRACVIAIEDGKITALLDPADVPAGSVIDYGELMISPGLIDPHVHINEPGRTEWEGFETATRAAAAGGVTTLVDMPLNSSPVTTTPEALRSKISAAEGKLHVDCGFHAGVVPSNAQSLQPLLEEGVRGVKAFLVHSGIDDFPEVAEEDLRTAMPAIARAGLPLLVHAELAGPAVHPQATRKYGEYLASRPRQWEDDAIAMMIALCKEFGCRVHIVHLSSSNSIAQLRDARNAGLPISVETCPHYLFFAAEDIPDGATDFKCAPPVRERSNNELLWQALEEGVIDMIASDHSPCPPAMKNAEAGDFMSAWGGVASLQFGLSIIWTLCRRRGISPEQMSKWMSEKTAQLAGLEGRKGLIAPGYDADLVVWNPDKSFVVNESIIHHRHKITPYTGQELTGQVHATWIRGQKVYEEGVFAAPAGKILLRKFPTIIH